MIGGNSVAGVGIIGGGGGRRRRSRRRRRDGRRRRGCHDNGDGSGATAVMWQWWQ